jgi:hypothetical protein
VTDSEFDVWRRIGAVTPDMSVREAARHAMLDEVALAGSSNAFGHHVWRFRNSWAAAAAMAAGVIVVGLGWNAPAGSPLHGIRDARQGITLSLPGADLAALHLKFAEQDLRDASQGLDRTASLSDAGNELAKAKTLLAANQHSALWDELVGDEQRLDQEVNPPAPSPAPTETPEPAETGAPRATEPPHATESEHQNSESQPANPTDSVQPSFNPENSTPESSGSSTGDG